MFRCIEPGTSYELVKFTVVNGKGIEPKWHFEEDGLEPTPNKVQTITFVRGDKRTITKDQFEEAVKALNKVSELIGRDKFSIEEMRFVENKTQSMVLKDLSKELETWREAEKTISLYINPINRVDGITQEQLLGMMIEDLSTKCALLPSDETKHAISNLKIALFWLQEHQRSREARKVDGTYQK